VYFHFVPASHPGKLSAQTYCSWRAREGIRNEISRNALKTSESDVFPEVLERTRLATKDREPRNHVGVFVVSSWSCDSIGAQVSIA